MDHPNVAELQKQFKLLQLKKMLHGYGVRDFNFSDDSKGRVGGEAGWGGGGGEEGDGWEDKEGESGGEWEERKARREEKEGR